MSDLIKREDAIDALNAEFSITGKENARTILNYLDLVKTRIKALPSADRPQAWTPCSERMPREYRTVLVTWKYKGKSYTTTAFRETKNAVTYWASDGQPNYTPLNVVAWMPLPKPWKGADDE